jgi:hypothetical protein
MFRSLFSPLRVLDWMQLLFILKYINLQIIKYIYKIYKYSSSTVIMIIRNRTDWILYQSVEILSQDTVILNSKLNAVKK